MPYYSVVIPRHMCGADLCGARASREVRTPTNDTVGWYCAKHAYAKVTDLNRKLMATSEAR